MAQPSVPSVPIELQRLLLERIISFRNAEPWRWTPDSAIAAYIDQAGHPWFACILGNAEEVFGLCLYRGAAGLAFCRTVRENPAFDPAQYRFSQDALTVWFGPKSELDPIQRTQWEEVGYSPKRGARLAWPSVRSHRPGLFPWYPDEQEVRTMIGAIPGILSFAEFYRAHPDCYAQHGPWDLPTVPADASPVRADTLEWRTWLNPKPEPIPAPIQVDVGVEPLRQIASLRQADEALEVDWFHSPEPVSDGGRPYFPRCLVVLRHDGGYCFAVELLKPGEDLAARLVPLILDAIGQLGARPTQILTTREDLVVRLQPLAAALDAEIAHERYLPAAAELLYHFMKRPPGASR